MKKYRIELSEQQMRLIADCLEDVSRFASGQWEMRYTIEKMFELPEGWLEEIEGYRKIYKSLDKDPNQIELNMDTGLLEFV